MSKRIEPREKFLQYHEMAVRLEDTILVFLGFDPNWDCDKHLYGDHEIWTYNLWTEQWKAHRIHPDPDAYVDEFAIRSKIGVAIAPDVYILAERLKGQCHECVLLKLTRCDNGSFASTTISLDFSQYTRPADHCAWEHGKKLWIFGGYEISSRRFSNKLFCCDPSVQTISRVICSGLLPSPREGASAAVIEDKVWLCGGTEDFDFFYKLDMLSFSWTKIETGMPRPLVGSFNGTLVPIQDSQLVLHGGNWSSIWIFDVESYTWRTRQDMYPRERHSGFTGLNGDVIILGGFQYTLGTVYKSFVNVRLWAKSLQQLAMKVVYENRTDLQWKSLPPKLIRIMMLTETE